MPPSASGRHNRSLCESFSGRLRGMDPDVFITIVFAGIVALAAIVGGIAGVPSARSDPARRPPPAPRDR